ncbi:FeoA family protein [Teredinibacter sp. KSP-S5-2]|uniref:FeoA family protein n=1 Tax=Teredinibacter sp. KSP-S5-2 TaxID=3034506 RepID=UPI00293503B8|nr:FeoA family protein [Teredinibacter sp. KSP-S5-2]WNO10835.1 FeoA family protein [Teredinibacter sp. KSP-S5-2]
MTLDQLAIGQHAHITCTGGGQEDFTSFCQSLGIEPGASVRVLRKAPGGSPLQVKVTNTLFAVRNLDAQQIKVKIA